MDFWETWNKNGKIIWNFVSKMPTAQFAQEERISMFNIQSISMKSLLKEMKSPYYKTCKKTGDNEDD